MNVLHTKRPNLICRIFERINVAIELYYIERDLAYERADLVALPMKVNALERHAEMLRVRQAILRNS